MQTSINKTVLSAILIALCVAMGYLFLYVPNVEMITASVFLAGAIMGPGYGLLIGIISETMFSVFNPYGMPIPTMLAAQVAVFGLIGATGGLLRKNMIDRRMRFVCCALAGLTLTLIYDMLTTLSFSLTLADVNLQKLTGIFASGMLFSAIHIGVNVLIFTLIVPVLYSRLQPHLPGYVR